MLSRYLLIGTSGVVIGLGLAISTSYEKFFPPNSELIANSEEFRADAASKFPEQVNLLDPEMAPPEIKPLVMQGFRVMMETLSHCREYAGNDISCNNCHFCGGATMGGKNGGISLVGVSKVYPRHLPNGKQITLAERIDGCFLRSLNGRPLPHDSPQMKAMIAYLDWISSGVASVPEDSWLGLKELRSHHIPDPEHGRVVFEQECAKCHGANGEGQPREYNLDYPALWGPHAFNDGAGMNNPVKFASFIYYNMPFQDPHLTIEEALDVAAFVTTRPRAHYKAERKPDPKEPQKQ